MADRPARNRTHRESLSSYTCFMAALHSAAPSAACLPRLLPTLCLHPLASSLPVSNSDQNAWKELVEEEEEGTCRKATHGCVCPTRLWLLQPQRSRHRPRVCSGLFQLFWTSITLGNIASRVRLFEDRLIHLSAVINELAAFDGTVLIKSLWYVVMVLWCHRQSERYIDGIQENTHILHSSYRKPKMKWLWERRRRERRDS